MKTAARTLFDSLKLSLALLALLLLAFGAAQRRTRVGA